MKERTRVATEPPAIERVRNVVTGIAEREGYRLVVLFGSLARGDREPGDVDLAIQAAEPLDAVALTNELIRELGYQEMDVCDLRTADPLVQMLVAREGKPLYERSAGEFDRFWSLAVRRFADTRKFREAERARIAAFLERTGEHP